MSALISMLQAVLYIYTMVNFLSNTGPRSAALIRPSFAWSSSELNARLLLSLAEFDS